MKVFAMCKFITFHLIWEDNVTRNHILNDDIHKYTRTTKKLFYIVQKTFLRNLFLK